MSSLESSETFLLHEDEKQAAFLRLRKKRSSCDLGPALPWIVTTVILSILSIALGFRETVVSLKVRGESNTFGTGFDTDRYANPITSLLKLGY